MPESPPEIASILFSLHTVVCFLLERYFVLPRTCVLHPGRYLNSPERIDSSWEQFIFPWTKLFVLGPIYFSLNEKKTRSTTTPYGSGTYLFFLGHTYLSRNYFSMDVRIPPGSINLCPRGTYLSWGVSSFSLVYYAAHLNAFVHTLTQIKSATQPPESMLSTLLLRHSFTTPNVTTPGTRSLKRT
jgi:hypothetical protein